MSSQTSELIPLKCHDGLDQIRPDPIDSATLEQARVILDDVRYRGMAALRHYAITYGDRRPEEPLVISKEEMARSAEKLPQEQLSLLERTADRIQRFAIAQRHCLSDLETSVEGGRAGHRILPVRSAGCYAPGGRYPLPSSVLMTVIPARVAGVSKVWVASPRPAAITIAAAHVAGADALLAVGGAQAIAAFAYGAGEIPACDVIVGPGNRWVSAAKVLVAGRVKIDMIAGPSELVIIADQSANPKIVALDLLAQAEHDPEALPILIALDLGLITRVRSELVRMLTEYPCDTARQSLQRGFALSADDTDQARCLANRIAPEHLQLSVENPDQVIALLKEYGGLFIGEQSAEVFGDYGIGPNHVLPTSGAARQTSGLSVSTFLRQPTWLKVDSSGIDGIAQDAAALARLEGLEWHARAAEARLAPSSSTPKLR